MPTFRLVVCIPYYERLQAHRRLLDFNFQPILNPSQNRQEYGFV